MWALISDCKGFGFYSEREINPINSPEQRDIQLDFNFKRLILSVLGDQGEFTKKLKKLKPQNHTLAGLFWGPSHAFTLSYVL
jgi:hypothetical protein